MQTKYNREAYHRHSIRLQQYDYAQDGAYFVTICTWNRECVFGDITHGVIDLSETGKIVREFWFEIQEHFGNIQLDAFVIMPNHIHGIMVLTDDICRGEVSSPVWKTGKTKKQERAG